MWVQAVYCFPPAAWTKLTGRHDLLDGWMVKWCSNGRWPKAKVAMTDGQKLKLGPFCSPTVPAQRHAAIVDVSRWWVGIVDRAGLSWAEGILTATDTVSAHEAQRVAWPAWWMDGEVA